MSADQKAVSCYKHVLVLCLTMFACLTSTAATSERKIFIDDDSVKATPAASSPLDKDEGIKCTRAELIAHEFSVICKEKYGEVLRITFQDLERGGREIIFQKKMVENDEVKFYMPLDLIKEAKTAVLIIMKGSNMFFKKIDITD